MTTLQTGEIFVAAGCVRVVLVLVLFWTRRRRLAEVAPLAMCAVRPPGVNRWRLGLLRLDGTHLRWFAVVGLTTRADLEWEREGLEVTTPSEESVTIPGLREAVAVSVGHPGADPFELAVERPLYMAIRSWLESAPPGRNVNIA